MKVTSLRIFCMTMMACTYKTSDIRLTSFELAYIGLLYRSTLVSINMLPVDGGVIGNAITVTAFCMYVCPVLHTSLGLDRSHTSPVDSLMNSLSTSNHTREYRESLALNCKRPARFQFRRQTNFARDDGVIFSPSTVREKTRAIEAGSTLGDTSKQARKTNSKIRNNKRVLLNGIHSQLRFQT